jgi:hypothetical protein
VDEVSEYHWQVYWTLFFDKILALQSGIGSAFVQSPDVAQASCLTPSSQILDALGDRVGEKFKVVVRRPRGKTATLFVTTEEAGPQSF